MERNDQQVLLSREELYVQVWAEPMTKLAHKYGLSDRGLAKLCDRMGIPTPSRGYWAKLQSGHKVKQVALPGLKEGQQEMVCLNSACRVEEKPEDLLEKELDGGFEEF